MTLLLNIVHVNFQFQVRMLESFFFKSLIIEIE